ncbi:TonB-dependent receptor plug domain-containing protein [Mesorhizobium sp. Pch-S]|uniref:TonB-dependent receptor plug domain-containing protein n=1 Tax=Mesorhizobium sp. Pch-S TaxID=2082387 RepID=UPI0032AFD994
MGTTERSGQAANFCGAGGTVARTLTALTAGVAVTALLSGASLAQEAAKPATQAATQNGQPAEADKTETQSSTLLDKIMLISRTGESAIKALASVSHVDQEQIDRRMAATPNELLRGVPGVTVQADARRTASSIKSAACRISVALRSSSTAPVRISSAPTTERNRPSTSTPN